ncbi:MAG TPA: glycosyl transferase [Lachnospiraceae bacterium]|nr:glycosyl transferase [Lachnospiraceae bacterium]
MRDIDGVFLDGNIENSFIGQGMEEEAPETGISDAHRYVRSSISSLENRRVFFINTVVGPGNSVGRLVEGLYRMLTEHGYECMVAYGRGDAPSDINSFKIDTKADIYFHGLMTRLTDRHGFYSKSSTLDLIDQIEAFDPDIVHLHNVHGYYLNIRYLFEYLRKSGRRVIWTLHDCWSFTGHCAHFEYVGCNKWINGCSNCEQLAEYPRSVFKDNSEKNYIDKRKLFTGIDGMTLVTPSEWLRQRVLQSFLKDYHTLVVPTGIDLSRFHPIEEERTEDNPVFCLKNRLGIRGKRVILGVANPWRDRKGLNQFINLSRIISDRYVIVLVGLNDSQLSSLPGSIKGLKKTESLEELCTLYSMADVYVNLTLEDTFPTTNIEALACGTPVITYKTGGSPESLSETTGIVVEKNSVQGVAAALDRIESLSGELFTVQQCVNQAGNFDRDIRFMEYIEEVYEGI